ncbi:unnamed protein product [Periconia digitata]|uniref:Uncharacterized protein n=1 Tax=Periconia digitata TaxID=1303443 RepID=A0A9W4U7U4_9PLEO|nr:unnamed protein product [Periconia digitata]
MQYTTLLTLLTGTTAVLAAPGSPVLPRQATPTIYARFYPDGGCHGDWVEDVVFPQNTNDCIAVNVAATYGSIGFLNNTATRTLKVYSEPGCDESGRHFELAPKELNCFAQQVKSAKFL